MTVVVKKGVAQRDAVLRNKVVSAQNCNTSYCYVIYHVCSMPFKHQKFTNPLQTNHKSVNRESQREYTPSRLCVALQLILIKI